MTQFIVVDADSIATLATAFHKYKEEVDKALTEVKTIKINAGDFTDADNLENLVTTRTDELTKNLTGLSKALETISTNLTTIATTYTDTEKQNGLTAKDLKDLVDGLEDDLPGFGDK